MIFFLSFFLFFVLLKSVYSGIGVHASVDFSSITGQMSIMAKQLEKFPPDAKEDFKTATNAIINTCNSILNRLTKDVHNNFQSIQTDLDKNFNNAFGEVKKGIQLEHQDMGWAIDQINQMTNRTAEQIEAWGQKNFNKAIEVMKELVDQLHQFELALIFEFEKMDCHSDANFGRFENLFIEIFDTLLGGNNDCRQKLGMEGKVIPYDSYVLHYKFKKCVLISDLDELSTVDDIVTKYEELDLLINSFLCFTNSSESLRDFFRREKFDVKYQLQYLTPFATPNRDFITMNETRHSTSKLVKEYARSLTNVLDVLNVVNSETTSSTVNSIIESTPSPLFITSFYLTVFLVPFALLVALISFSMLMCCMCIDSCKSGKMKKKSISLPESKEEKTIQNLIITEVFPDKERQIAETGEEEQSENVEEEGFDEEEEFPIGIRVQVQRKGKVENDDEEEYYERNVEEDENIIMIKKE